MNSTQELEAYLERTNWLGKFENEGHVCSCSGNQSAPTSTIVPKSSDIPLTKSPDTILPSGNRVDGSIAQNRTENITVVPTPAAPVEPVIPSTPESSSGQEIILPPIEDQSPILEEQRPVISDPLPIAPGNNINYLDGPLNDFNNENPFDELAVNAFGQDSGPEAKSGHVNFDNNLPIETEKVSQAGSWLLGLLALGLVVRQATKKR